MSYYQRFILVSSVIALSLAPAALAGDEVSEPSVFDATLDAILDIFIPDVDTVVPEVPENQAGPNIVFIG